MLILLWKCFHWCNLKVDKSTHFSKCIYQRILKSNNPLWPSDAIWHWISWSTLVQVMACCLTTPSHYLNQCWLTINKIPRHSFQGNIKFDTQKISIPKICLKFTYSKLNHISQGQWVIPKPYMLMPCYVHLQVISRHYMGQVMKQCLSCCLILLSIDHRTR